MNSELHKYATDYLKENLSKLEEKNRVIFKRLYSYPNGLNKPPDLTANINDVVDKIPDDKLDWAMQQVKRSMEIMAKELENKT